MTTNYLLTQLAEKELLVIGEEKLLPNNLLYCEVMIFSVCDRRGGYAFEKISFDLKSLNIKDNFCHISISNVNNFEYQPLFEKALLENVPDGAPVSVSPKFKNYDGKSQPSPSLLTLFTLHRLNANLRPAAFRDEHKQKGACLGLLSHKLDKYVSKHTLQTLNIS